MAGIYVHIPFCQSRCIYCDFYSTTSGRDVMERYVRALEHEMVLRRHYIIGTCVHSIYIGGGTPSVLPVGLLTEVLAAIHRHFKVESDAEVTVEANPDDVTPAWLQALTQMGVSRISMGAQTFDDGLLRFLGRRHTAGQVVQAVADCRAAGIGDISIDLIYGLPGQTMEIWQHDVRSALSLDIQHLSAYALSYEDGTRLHRMLQSGQVSETDDETSWQMYSHLLAATRQAGFVHYEISNFALPGHQARHNSSYWQGTAYLGLGAGAHSYDGERSRRANLPDLHGYIRSAADGGDVPHEVERLGDDELYDEFVMTRLRTGTGIPLAELSPADRSYCLRMAAPHLAQGLLREEDGHLRLTPEGIFTSNDIISDLMK